MMQHVESFSVDKQAVSTDFLELMIFNLIWNFPKVGESGFEIITFKIFLHFSSRRQRPGLRRKDGNGYSRRATNDRAPP